MGHLPGWGGQQGLGTEGMREAAAWALQPPRVLGHPAGRGGA